MNNIRNRIISFAINIAKKNKLVQSLFESPIDLESFVNYGYFSDSNGYKHKLYEGLRSKIKPGWQKIFVNNSGLQFDQSFLSKKAAEGKLTAEKFLPLVSTYCKNINDKKILEIGCHSGAVSYALSDMGAGEVIGTEFSGYKINSVGQGEIKEINNALNLYRAEIAKYSQNPEGVYFIDDDICNTHLPEKSFDIVCSWDVLEHLNNPAEAFKNISKVLKPDGVAIHEYNPFFSLNGGHSYCTLDFLWGHVRLNKKDFLKYLEEFRSEEKSKAYSFYLNGLNRMTLEDLKKYSDDAGLEILSVLMFTKEQHLRMLDDIILNQCQKNYPNLQVADLISPRIIIIHKKQ